jgi:N-methylhydantoinase A
MLFNGHPLTPLDELSVCAVVRELQNEDVESVAVCLLHSYANPAHERRVAKILEERVPSIAVSLSSKISPEPGEFERWSTTILDAYVKPLLESYMEDLEAEARSRGLRAELLYMTSGGGILSQESARRQPIRFLVSGPAAGVSVGVKLAKLLQERTVITYDMGGTSTDVSLVRDMRASVTHERVVAGLPVRTPQLDILTIGAGAGSVATMGVDGGLRVGPQSAGADPGPACYGKGGTAATVTDANLMLGRLSASLAGGGIELDVDLSQHALRLLAIETGVADELRLAEGIIEICVRNMSDAIRTVSIERGHDPRKSALVAFGGAGPMHALEVAENLSIPLVIVPPIPGNACALGLLLSDLKHDYVEPCLGDLDATDLSELDGRWTRLAARGRTVLAAEGVPHAATLIEYTGDLRYVGQSFHLTVPLAPRMSKDDIRQQFEASYEALYGYRRPTMPVELVAARVTAVGHIGNHALLSRPHSLGGCRQERRRAVWLNGSMVECAVFQRDRLAGHGAIEGPCLIEEYGSCTVVLEGWRGLQDDGGNLVLRRES